MKILVFGATGMVGQGVLRECLLAADVELVQTVGRTATGVLNPKLREVVQKDLLRYPDEAEFSGFDACFFCLGVSSFGMKEADYERITYRITLAAAELLSRLNPHMAFTYVSGANTDSSEQGRSMWARVKGKTENALLRLPFKAAYMFRPGAIEALHGAQSKTPMYRALYVFVKPLVGTLRRLFPDSIVTTEQVGLAMLNAARHGAPKQILDPKDIRLLSEVTQPTDAVPPQRH